MAAKDNKTRVYTADLLLTDVVVKLDGNPALQALVKEYQHHGELTNNKNKYAAKTRAEFERFLSIIDLEHTQIIPGGSSANTVTTLSNLMPNEIDATFMGVVGESKKPGDPDSLIRDSLKEANVKLLAQTNGHAPESGMSIVIKPKDGQRLIVTWQGNMKQILKAPMIKDEMIENSDAVFVQGSLWQKLDETLLVHNGIQEDKEKLGFADHLLDLRWKKGKDLWLAMPTQAEFGTEVRSHEEKAVHFQELIKSANVILGNDDEVSRVFTTKQERERIFKILSERGITDDDLNATKENPKPIATLLEAHKLQIEEVKQFNFMNKSVVAETAFARLQKTLDTENAMEHARSQGRWKGNTEQVAFISRGAKEQALIFTAHQEPVKVTPLPDPPNFENTLGAGDTAFAGFLAAYEKLARQEDGHCRKLGAEELELCGNMAMRLANENLKHDAARVPNPREAIRQSDPKLYERVLVGLKRAWGKVIGDEPERTWAKQT